MGSVDVALEIVHGTRENRRIVKGAGRIYEIRELVYERDADGQFVYVGTPDDLGQQELQQRVLAATGEQWMTQACIKETISEPRPGDESLRKALSTLCDSGLLERDPPAGERRPGATYKFRRARTGLADQKPTLEFRDSVRGEDLN